MNSVFKDTALDVTQANRVARLYSTSSYQAACPSCAGLNCTGNRKRKKYSNKLACTICMNCFHDILSKTISSTTTLRRIRHSIEWLDALMIILGLNVSD